MGANVLDEILGEASDLLNAAAEAQALGRLKMAGSYLLLAHARLVGLGKRFDLVASLALKQPPSSSISTCSINTFVENNGNGGNLLSTGGISSTTSTTSSLPDCKKGEALPSSDVTTSVIQGTSTSNNGTSLDKDDVALQLMSKLLPNGVKLDKAMLEHLAKSALELHKKRSPSTSSNQKNSSSSISFANTHDVSVINTIDSNSNATASNNRNGIAVAWTFQEHQQCVKLSGEGAKADTIAKILGTKSEAQVRAHLRVESEKERTTAFPLDNLQLKESANSVDPELESRDGTKLHSTNITGILGENCLLSSTVKTNTIDCRRIPSSARFNAREMIMGKGVLNHHPATAENER